MSGPPNGWRASAGLTTHPGLQIVQAPPAPIVVPAAIPAGNIPVVAPQPTTAMYQPQYIFSGNPYGYGVPMLQHAAPPLYGFPPPPPPPSRTIPGATQVPASQVPGSRITTPARVGTTYLHAPEHIYANVIVSGFTIDPPRSSNMRFTPFSVPLLFTGKTLMMQAGHGEGWQMTEVHEQGGGAWTVGTTIKFSDDKAKETLDKYGWKDAGHERKPPIWLFMQRAPAA
jgi:hypothetical protein